MMGMGRATTSTPEMAHMPPTTLPSGVTGAMSPYPTVVMVIRAHQ